jgi:hypothetical protein
VYELVLLAEWFSAASTVRESVFIFVTSELLLTVN